MPFSRVLHTFPGHSSAGACGTSGFTPISVSVQPQGPLLSWWAMISKSSFSSSVEGGDKEAPQRRAVYTWWSWKANPVLPDVRASTFTIMLSYLCHVSISIYLGSPSAGFGNLMLFFSWYHPWFYFSHFSPHSWVALRVRSGIHFYKMNPLWCLAHGLHTTPNNIILLTSLIYCPTIPSNYVIREKGLCLNYIVIFTNPTQCVETRINSHSVHICWVPCMSESIQFSPRCSDRWSGIHVSN